MGWPVGQKKSRPVISSSRVRVKCVTRTSKKSGSRSKAIELRSWRVVLIRNRGQFLGYVEAPSVEAAELMATKEFNLNPFHRKRLLLRERL